jgi:hypothetical protein
VAIAGSGEMQQLFPNPFQRDNLVRAGQTVVIGNHNSPLPLQVAHTVGKVELKVMASALGQQREARQTLTLVAPSPVPFPVLEAQPDTMFVPRRP